MLGAVIVAVAGVVISPRRLVLMLRDQVRVRWVGVHGLHGGGVTSLVWGPVRALVLSIRREVPHWARRRVENVVSGLVVLGVERDLRVRGSVLAGLRRIITGWLRRELARGLVCMEARRGLVSPIVGLPVCPVEGLAVGWVGGALGGLAGRPVGGLELGTARGLVLQLLMWMGPLLSRRGHRIGVELRGLPHHAAIRRLARSAGVGRPCCGAFHVGRRCEWVMG